MCVHVTLVLAQLVWNLEKVPDTIHNFCSMENQKKVSSFSGSLLDNTGVDYSTLLLTSHEKQGYNSFVVNFFWQVTTPTLVNTGFILYVN